MPTWKNISWNGGPGMETKKKKGFALPLMLIVVLGVGSFFIQILFNKNEERKNKCEYRDSFFPAEVIRIDTVSQGYCEIYLRVTLDVRIDTILYSAEFGGLASFEQIKRSHLEKGGILKYVVRELRSGDCPAHVEALLLEQYYTR